MVSRVGSPVFTAGTVTTSLTATLPAHAAGDRLFVVLTGKYSGTTMPAAPSGWSRHKTTGNLGTGSAGNDTGLCWWGVYSRIATASNTTNPTFSAGATQPNSWEAWSFTYRLDAGESGWSDLPGVMAGAVEYINDGNTAAPLGGMAPNDWTLNPGAGDAILAVGVVPTDAATGLTSASISVDGLSGGSQDSGYGENAQGQDTAAMWCDWQGFTGTKTNRPSASFTNTSGNHAGGIAIIAIRANRPSTGSASGTWSFTGSAVGAAPVVPDPGMGTATGTFTFTGSAAGKKNPAGTGVGTFAFAGSAVGVAPEEALVLLGVHAGAGVLDPATLLGVHTGGGTLVPSFLVTESGDYGAGLFGEGIYGGESVP